MNFWKTFLSILTNLQIVDLSSVQACHWFLRMSLTRNTCFILFTIFSCFSVFLKMSDYLASSGMITCFLSSTHFKKCSCAQICSLQISHVMLLLFIWGKWVDSILFLNSKLSTTTHHHKLLKFQENLRSRFLVCNLIWHT